jgi:hypothetical protein
MTKECNKDKVFRTTKCFGAWSGREHYNGSFPAGFMKWIKELGYWGEKRCYLCAGMIKDDEAVKVDIRPEVKPTLLEDARNTSLLPNEFDFVVIDPPYTKELAERMYGTGEYYAGINSFAKEGARICKHGGLILTLSYEIPKRLPDCDFVAVCGIYQVPSVSYMRCLTISRKKLKEASE